MFIVQLYRKQWISRVGSVYATTTDRHKAEEFGSCGLAWLAYRRIAKETKARKPHSRTIPFFIIPIGKDLKCKERSSCIMLNRKA